MASMASGSTTPKQDLQTFMNLYDQLQQQKLDNEDKITELETLNTLQNLLPDENIQKIFNYNAIDFRQILLNFFYAEDDPKRTPFKQLMHNMGYLKENLSSMAFGDKENTFEIFLPKAIMLAMLQQCCRMMYLGILKEDEHKYLAELVVPTLILELKDNKPFLEKPWKKQINSYETGDSKIIMFNGNEEDKYTAMYVSCACRLLQVITRRVVFKHGEFDTKHIKPIIDKTTKVCVGVYMDLSEKSMIAPYNTKYMLTIGKPKTPVQNNYGKYYMLDDLKTLLNDKKLKKRKFVKQILNDIDRQEREKKATDDIFDEIRKDIKRLTFTEKVTEHDGIGDSKAGGYKLKL